MDISAVGRTRGDERAVIVELTAVRGHERTGPLVLAGIAAAVAIGLLSNAITPPNVSETGLVDGPIVRPNDLHLALRTDPGRSPRPAGIELLSPTVGTNVIGGQVRVSFRTAPEQRVHLSVTLGDLVVGWRDVTTGADGTWDGLVRVFAPRDARTAVVRAATRFEGASAGVADPITLDGGAEFVLWDASLVAGAGGRPAVAFRASAPLAFSHIAAWVTDASGNRVGKTTGASRVEPSQEGSAGGRELGLGTVSGEIQLGRRIAGAVLLNFAWRDPVTGAPGELQRTLDGGATLRP